MRPCSNLFANSSMGASCGNERLKCLPDMKGSLQIAPIRGLFGSVSQVNILAVHAVFKQARNQLMNIAGPEEAGYGEKVTLPHA